MSKEQELADFALTVIREPIMFTDERCNGPVCSVVAVMMGKRFTGRDDPIYESYGNGARGSATRLANEYKAKMIAEKARELFAPSFDEEETRL